MRKVDAIERIFSRREILENGCWKYSGFKNEKGYGKIQIGRTPRSVHRIIWAFFNGREPKANYFICHHCDNPSCFNPDHLFEGTPKDNSQDMIRKGRAFLQKNPETYRGKKHPRVRMTKKELELIEKLLKTNMTQKQIGLEVGFSQSKISEIRNKKSWIQKE